MAKTLRLKETLAEALDVQSVWQAIPDFKMGDVSLTDFTAAANAADSLTKQHKNNAVERAGLRANRDDKVRKLNELVTRFRSGIRAAYGPDSPLYQQAGGTRLSARKSPKRPAESASEASTAQTTEAPAAQHA